MVSIKNVNSQTIEKQKFAKCRVNVVWIVVKNIVYLLGVF
jgi:hypothetical protein